MLPVCTYHHYSDWWGASEKLAFYNVIKGYNVIGIFHGHEHQPRHYTWKPSSLPSDPEFDVYSTGSPSDVDMSPYDPHTRAITVARVTENEMSVQVWYWPPPEDPRSWPGEYWYNWNNLPTSLVNWYSDDWPLYNSPSHVKPITTTLLPDFDHDGDVDIRDYSRFANLYGRSGPLVSAEFANFDGDGDIDDGDLEIFLRYWLDGSVRYWATFPFPANGQTMLELDTGNNLLLSWIPAEKDVSHDYYIGTDGAEVKAASRDAHAGVTYTNTNDPNYSATLEQGTWYYWKVDEVNETNDPQWFGPTWSFRTEIAPCDAIPPEMIIATASSDRFGNVMSIVNGSGLDASGLLHDNDYRYEWCSDFDGGGYTNPNPGTTAGPAWLRFELQNPYRINRMWVWNFNEGPPWLDRGLRNVTIEYSMTGGSDSSEWTKLGDYEWPQGAGYGWNELNHLAASNPWYDPDEYPGFEGPDFGDVLAKYVVITANDVDGNWGGTLNGIPGVDVLYCLSEVRFCGTAP